MADPTFDPPTATPPTGAVADRVLVLMGSHSDLPVMRQAADVLAEMGVESDLRISSAHRALDRTTAIVREAEASGCGVIVAGAGLAAHLPGVVAACTTLPVIGVPLRSGPLDGVDALHAIVQMPRGVPVATVAIDGAHNAGLLAAQMVALVRPDVAGRLAAHRQRLAREVERRDAELQAELEGAASSSPLVDHPNLVRSPA